MKKIQSLSVICVLLMPVSAMAVDLKNYDAASELRKIKSLTKGESDSKLKTKLLEDKRVIDSFRNKNMPSHYDESLGLSAFIWVDPKVSKSVVRKKSASSSITTDSIKGAAFEYVKKIHPLKSTLNVDSAVAAPFTQKTVLDKIHNNNRGPIIVQFKQVVDGVEVFAHSLNIMMKQNLELVATSGYFANAKPDLTAGYSLVLQSTLSNFDAVKMAYKDLKITANTTEIHSVKPGTTPYTHFDVQIRESGFSAPEIARSKSVWYALGSKLIPAYYVEVALQDNNSSTDSSYYGYVISAANGDVLFRKNMVEQEHFNYRTFADSNKNNAPVRGPMGNIYPLIDVTPENAIEKAPLDYKPSSHQINTLQSGPISTNDPWLAPGALETRGNNVDAYVDIFPGDGLNEGQDYRAHVTSSNTFDWAYNYENPISLSSRKATIVNLFYMNNYLHDFFYDHGFDEVSGNAQVDNYGRGGLDGDDLKAEGQDYGGRNNANMRTPADGARPRMQMYIFNPLAIQGEAYDLKISSAGLEIPIGVVEPSRFGPEEFDIKSELIRYEDGEGVSSDACQPATNATALAGKIAIIDRGLCRFVIKVKNAQNAGAVGVVVANNVGGDVVLGMGGNDSSIIIPSLAISQNAGAAIYAVTDTTNVDEMYRFYRPDRDGTLANGIVAHEWGHYISNRLIQDSSGLINNQGRSMGEGWGDFMAIFFAIEEGDNLIPGNENYQGLYSAGSWVDKNPYYGIRRLPYTTDMRLNAATFKNISDEVPFVFDHPVKFTGRNSEVHNAGEIWATMLLEAYVALLNDSSRLSFTEAQSRMADYLVAGMKMTPFAPTFVEARDGILAAAYANDIHDFKLLTKAFAKRGLGFGAIAPDRIDNAHTGVVESYEQSLTIFRVDAIELDLNYISNDKGEHDIQYCSADNILDEGETALLKLSISNSGTEVLNKVGAVVSSNADVEFENDGKIYFRQLKPFSGTYESELEFTLDSASYLQNIEINIDFPTHMNVGVQVPEAQSLPLTVHYRLMPGRVSDDMEKAATARFDWSIVVDEPLDNVFTSQARKTFKLEKQWNEQFGSGQVWRGNDNNFVSDVSLVSPSVDVAANGDFVMSFEHYHKFESSVFFGQLNHWDGGVIEISIDDGAWEDVVIAGGVIDGWFYNESLFQFTANPLRGRVAFADESPPILNATRISFGDSLAGKSVQFRFRIGTDSSVGELGWIIDNVAFENAANLPFSISVPNPDDFCD